MTKDEAIKQIQGMIVGAEWLTPYMVEALDMAIEALGEGPTGKWNVYEVANTEEEQPIAWECSKCGEVVDARYNFCPNCRANMGGQR